VILITGEEERKRESRRRSDQERIEKKKDNGTIHFKPKKGKDSYPGPTFMIRGKGKGGGRGGGGGGGGKKKKCWNPFLLNALRPELETEFFTSPRTEKKKKGKGGRKPSWTIIAK